METIGGGRTGRLINCTAQEVKGWRRRYHRRGSPWHVSSRSVTEENAYVDSFNEKLRDECLNAQWLTSNDDAREEIATWRDDYNEVRPHSWLADLSPLEWERATCENRTLRVV